MPHSNSVYSSEEIKKIARNINEWEDRCVDNPSDPQFSVDLGLFPYEGERTLMVVQAEKAMKYIAACVKKYPFQLRRDLALPMWRRFAEEWNHSGDFSRAMRAI